MKEAQLYTLTFFNRQRQLKLKKNESSSNCTETLAKNG